MWTRGRGPQNPIQISEGIKDKQLLYVIKKALDIFFNKQFTKFHEYQEDKRPQAPRRHITELLKGYPCVPANIHYKMSTKSSSLSSS